jgi:phage host-nuclease inhibitor protein Gam
MTKTRIKKKVIDSVSIDEANAAFAELAKADSSNKKMNAEMDLAITKIREKYQDKLEENNLLINEKVEILEMYLKLNPSVLGNNKSIELIHGTIGYRKNTPSLKTLKGFTWESCLNLAKVFLDIKYVRKKEELDKEALLADRENLIVEKVKEGDLQEGAVEEDKGVELQSFFSKCGFEVKQEETFFIKPKNEGE